MREQLIEEVKALLQKAPLELFPNGVVVPDYANEWNMDELEFVRDLLQNQRG